MKKTLTASPIPKLKSRWPARRIVVPIDFSGASVAALRLARAMAVEQGAALDVIHVVEPFHPDWLMDTGALQERAHDSSRDALAALRAAELKDVEAVNVEMLEGHPAHSVCAFAKKRGADLIVLATSGRSGLERVLMGSVVEHIVRHAPCAVMVVR